MTFAMLWMKCCQYFMLLACLSNFRSDCETTKSSKRTQNGRIIGGSSCDIEDYGFIISVQKWLGDTYHHICGGTLLSKHFVLSAAHCYKKTQHNTKWKAVAGSSFTNPAPHGVSTAVSVTIEYVCIHPDFNDETYEYDVSILKLTKDIKESRSITYTLLPTADILHGEELRGMYNECTVLGWGSQKTQKGIITDLEAEEGYNPHLQCINLPIIYTADCHSLSIGSIFQNHICTLYEYPDNEPSDACIGDSGGPLVCGPKKMQFGIVSYGIGCGQPYVPGVYTRVDLMLEYISDCGNDKGNACARKVTFDTSSTGVRRPSYVLAIYLVLNKYLF